MFATCLFCADDFIDHMDVFANWAQGVKALFQSSIDVTNTEFTNFVTTTGLSSDVAFARKVVHADRPAWEAVHGQIFSCENRSAPA